MKLVPKTGRTAWHEKAMDAAKGTDLRALIELFIETKEMGRLAELVRGATDEALEQASHYATEPAAKKLEGVHPGLAARLWRAQGMRIVDGAKSKDYDAALSTSSALGAAMSGRPRRRMGGHRAPYSAPDTTARPASCPGLRRWPPRPARPAFVSGSRQETLGRAARRGAPKLDEDPATVAQKLHSRFLAAKIFREQRRFAGAPAPSGSSPQARAILWWPMVSTDRHHALDESAGAIHERALRRVAQSVNWEEQLRTKKAVTLPLQGSDFLQLATLTPGVNNGGLLGNGLSEWRARGLP